MKRGIALLVVVIAALALGGCSGAASSTPAGATPLTPPTSAAATLAGTFTATALPITPVPVASAAPPATATAAAEPPTATPSAAETPASSPAADDLASLIPSEIAGITAEAMSYTGQEYVDIASGGDPQAVQVIEDQFTNLGATVDEVSVATGDYYSDDDYVRISAMRVAGADGATLLETWVQNTIDSAPEFNSGMSATAEDATIGGKPVSVITTLLGSSVYDVQYIYGLGDTIVTVKGGSAEIIAEALSKVP